MANINEQVYGAKENWYVPSQYSEFGNSQPAEVYYYNQIDADEKLKIKVANYNTLETPVTTMRSQMNGQYPSYTYAIRNNWIPTEFTMDNSIVQFGIGSQSGLANQEWWYVDREYGASNPSQNDPPTLKNTDSYEIVNMCLAVRGNYAPYEFCSYGQGSILTPYENGFMYWQGILGQTFNTPDSVFADWYSTQYGYPTGYFYSKLVTQIPIKNLKLTPVIYAYNNAIDNYRKFTSISDYITEKNTYPNIFCIKAKFTFRTGNNDDIRYDGIFDCYPWFFNQTSFLKGYGYRFNNQDGVYGDNIYYPNRGDKQTGEGITVAGRVGYDHGPNGNMMGNEIYWTGHNDSSTANSFTIGQGGRVLQTPDFKFELGTKNLFYCYVANMSDDDITEGIRKQLASFGLFFTDGENDLNLGLDDDKTFLGILENGVGYGRYSHGTDNRNQQQWNWDTMEENNYDPENPPTPIMPDNWNDDANNPYLRGQTQLVNNWYLMTESMLKEVFEKMTGIDLVAFDKNLTYGLNPIDCIIQARRIYCTNAILDGLIPTQVTDISFGRLELNIIDTPSNNLLRLDFSKPVTYEVVKSYPVGEPSSYRDFRSYMPFTTCAFYDAFCGIIELDPAKILNKYISIYQTVDALSGDKITSLYSSETPNNIGERVATLTGNCSEEIPINGLQAADYIRNKYLLSQQEDIALWNLVSRSAMGAGGASISGVSGNVIGAATQAVGTIANSFIAGNQLGTIDYQLTHLTPQVSKVSKGTPNTESGVVFGPTLFLYLPKMNENYNELLYGNLTGFAGYKVVKPKDLSVGTHIFSHPKISISGTKNEAYMLVDQLQKGIIIK